MLTNTSVSSDRQAKQNIHAILETKAFVESILLISSVALRFLKVSLDLVLETNNFTARVITSLIRKYFLLAYANMTLKRNRIGRTGVKQLISVGCAF